MDDDITLDLQDLMEPGTTSAPDAAIESSSEPGQPDMAVGDPSVGTQAPSELDELRAELKRERDEKNKVLDWYNRTVSSQPQAKTDTATHGPKVEDVLSKFESGVQPALAELVTALRSEIKSQSVSREEWDQAKPALSEAILSIAEQRARDGLRNDGYAPEIIERASTEMKRMIGDGQQFQNYEAGYNAGLRRALAADQQKKARATVQANAETEKRQAVANNTAPHTEAKKVQLKLSKDMLLHDPVGALEAIRQAGVK